MINWKGAVILFAIVAVFGVHLYQTRAQPGLAGPVAKTFVGCTAADTVELQLTRAADAKMVDLKRPTRLDHWSIGGAAGGPANDSEVDGILTELHTLIPSDTLKAGAAGVDYGFDPPHLAVLCRVGSGVSFNLSVGKQSFDRSSRFAQLGGDPRVYVLSGAEVGRLDQFLDQPPYRPSPIPSGPSPSPTT